ncbi:hypothetical protein TEA_020643 [Camellia sinensis var. sinensis]|uniref:Uncharacterized protein n=1 Tax=Camellia sinensis var. sinensis TaxID=542762 RepID=A0A4V3WJD7_CAMSN|nr:hypothetical protein TEA_020643 [Camellia sinensis var. sinensis]
MRGKGNGEKRGPLRFCRRPSPSASAVDRSLQLAARHSSLVIARPPSPPPLPLFFSSSFSSSSSSSGELQNEECHLQERPAENGDELGEGQLPAIHFCESVIAYAVGMVVNVQQRRDCAGGGVTATVVVALLVKVARNWKLLDLSDEMPAHVGFLGLGIMGSPMAQNLIKAGCNVTVWNRTKSKCDPLISLGAKYKSSPEEVAASCDVTFAMLAEPESALDVACGEHGAARGMSPGKGYIDVSTVDGATSKLIGTKIKDTGALFLEAPVSGSKKPAEDGQLIFLTAGDRSLFEMVAPLLDIMGKQRKIGFLKSSDPLNRDTILADKRHSGIVGAEKMGRRTRLSGGATVASASISVCDGEWIGKLLGDSFSSTDNFRSIRYTWARLLSRFFLGDVGNGAAMKLVVNMIMGSMMASFSEGMLLSEKVGLDPRVLVEVVSQGAISSPMFSMKGPSMVQSMYPTAFPLKHQQKDLRLALGLAESVSQPTPIAAAANELYKVAKSRGLSDHDFSAVIEALRIKLQTQSKE